MRFYKVTWMERGVFHAEGGLWGAAADNLIRRLKSRGIARDITLTSYVEAQ
jgi:hypothetical protein